MPYLFTCPHCQTKTQVEDRFSGLEGNCVTCGEEIQLPDFAADSADLPPAQGNDSKTIGWIAAALVSILLLGSLLFMMARYGGQTMTKLSNNRDQTSSIRNLEKIAAALNAYAADHGSYPPAETRDANNIALHSWRVLILPYLGEEDLYNRFNLDLAWSHPDNMQAAMSDIPTVYQHPRVATRGVYTESAYFLITGTGTLFPNAGPLGPSDITDDPSQTILVTEGSPLTSSSLWTEPLDLDFASMQGRLGTNPGNEPGGLLDGGVAIVTTDGRGHFIPDTIDPAVFRALVTPRGDERLRDDTLD